MLKTDLWCFPLWLLAGNFFLCTNMSAAAGSATAKAKGKAKARHIPTVVDNIRAKRSEMQTSLKKLRAELKKDMRGCARPHVSGLSLGGVLHWLSAEGAYQQQS